MVVQGCQGYRRELTVKSTVNKGKVCRACEVARVRPVSLATLPFKGIVVIIKGVVHTWVEWCGSSSFEKYTINKQGKMGSL